MDWNQWKFTVKQLNQQNVGFVNGGEKKTRRLA